MTGQNNFIDKNPENEENHFKNISHEERIVTKSAADSYLTWLVTCHLNFELTCGDIPTIISSIKKSSISWEYWEYYVMNESNYVDFLLRLTSISLFWGQGVLGFYVGISLYIYVSRPLLFFCKLPISSEYSSQNKFYPSISYSRELLWGNHQQLILGLAGVTISF